MTVNDNFGKISNNINPINHSQNKKNILKTDSDSRTKSFADVLKQTINTANAANTAANNVNNNNNRTSGLSSDSNAINELKLRQYRLNNVKNSSELIFSKHAQQRLTQRNIDIAPELAAKISDASKRAYDKNIKNALILTEGAAFIVNTASNVVVTTMNSSEMRDNIITNIDGTVIL